ncbi:type III-B CRISPR module RAMP protein Cmr6 [Staphylospora marina]|uniref:type III-B CRISPR module RAMP protein Cmr6 n=1 Tax=Staphylospora marina TaxID=2490858 RepID=UPI000F5C2266|nr:type III-B CRISPR module RAMP protein Cmr6 [Staphylospora marina]
MTKGRVKEGKIEREQWFLPLYRGPERIHQCPVDGHIGLWYEKFCDRWERDKKHRYPELGRRKQDWIQTVTGIQPTSRHRELVSDMVHRMEELVLERKGHILPMKTAGRFVTGLGRPHPVENGFSWHPTLGTAVLPGSSVKGVVRAWAEQWAEAEQDDIERIFGSRTGKNVPHRVGSVIFLDALPTTPVKLEADVMTPHVSEYYRDPDRNAPDDMQDPTPIPFLTVASGQTFLFAVMPRIPSCETCRKDAEQVMDWLKEALDWIGAGAKTAVGYGRFEVDNVELGNWKRRLEEKERARAEEEARRNMSPILREIHDDGCESDEQRFMEALKNKWIPRLQDPDVPVEERREIAVHLANWYQTHKPDQWKKPNKKNKERVQQIKDVLNQTESR